MKEAFPKEKSWIFKIFFVGTLLKAAGDIVYGIGDILGLSSKKKK